MAVGTLVLVEEDRTSSYYQSLFGYFLGEALATNQATAVCSASKAPEKILKSAPRVVASTPEGNDELKRLIVRASRCQPTRPENCLAIPKISRRS